MCDKPGKMGDIRGVIENVLNVDLRFGAHGKEPSGDGILLIGRDLAQRDRHGARFQGFDQMALLCGGKAARGLAGDLNIEVRGALAELAQKLGIKPEVQNMPLLGIAHMRMKAIGTRSMAGQRAGDRLFYGDGEGGVIRLGQPRPIRRDHKSGQCGHAASALSMAVDSLPTSSSICASSMINGGASSTWSPCCPSIVPDIG